MPMNTSGWTWLPMVWRLWHSSGVREATAMRRAPDLILLDLNLPRMDGREVLAQIKQDTTLKTIPTIILTTSAAEADIATSYQLHANSYLRKPVQLDEFEALVKSINDFWLIKVVLPEQGHSE